MDQRISNDDWMDARIRMAERESDETHAACLDEMLHGIARVAVQCLANYNIRIDDRDIVDWLEAERDSLMDNLLWQEWGGASDHIPSDRRAHCETALREARKWFEQKGRKALEAGE